MKEIEVNFSREVIEFERSHDYCKLSVYHERNGVIGVSSENKYHLPYIISRIIRDNPKLEVKGLSSFYDLERKTYEAILILGRK